MSVPSKIVIATRASRLALWQAYHVKAELEKQYPQLTVELLELTTKGDKILDKSLSKIGGKGLFIKELELALLDGRADLAVHSLKDVPMELPEPFVLSTILERGNPHDAFVSNDYNSLSEMPAGAIVGTSSLRRESQIRAQYPHLVIKPLRGNLDTRLKKLDNKEFDAIVLAAAGLERLNLTDRIKTVITAEDSLPAAGQGALGIEVLKTRQDLIDLLSFLNCSVSTATAIAERALSAQLGGSCQVPIAAHAISKNDQIQLKALVALPDGSKMITSIQEGPIDNALSIGIQAASDLKAQGAEAVLQEAIQMNQ